jgi:hypothetical protein
MLPTMKVVRGFSVFALLVVAVSAAAEEQYLDSCPKECPEVANSSCYPPKECPDDARCESTKVPKQCNIEDCRYVMVCGNSECSGPKKGQIRAECLRNLN